MTEFMDHQCASSSRSHTHMHTHVPQIMNLRLGRRKEIYLKSSLESRKKSRDSQFSRRKELAIAEMELRRA